MRRILFLLILGLFACSHKYNGVIASDFHETTGHKFVERIPVKVGLVQDTKVKKAKFKTKSETGTININLHPGLINAIKTELETIFDEVTVLDNAGQRRNEQFLISPKFAPTHEISSYSCTIQLTLLFKDTKYEPVVKFVNYRTITYEDRQAKNIFIASGACVPLVPISGPVLWHRIGERETDLAIAKLEDGITYMLKGISHDILSNRQRLLEYLKK